VAGSLSLAADRAPTTAPAPAPPSIASGQIESPLKLLEEQPPPVVAPAVVDKTLAHRKKALIREGAIIPSRVARMTRDADGEWWTIPDPRTGTLRLLPCRLLESVEDVRAGAPDAQFRLGGEICRYKGKYYLLLAHAAEVLPAGQVRSLVTEAPATRPSGQVPGAEPVSGTAKDEPDPFASAADVAAELMKEPPDNPIIAPIVDSNRPGEGAASVAPPRRPVPIGASRVVVHRLARLTKSSSPGWYAISFVSDNTVQEPPMRVLPNLHLQRMEAASGGGKVPGALFYVTGEIERYRGVDYILLRNVIRKRDMGQF